MNQPDLPLFEPLETDPDAWRFLHVLKESGQWMSAADVLAILVMDVTETNRRHVRSWAEEAAGEVISGQLGYRHTSRATAEEVQHFCKWMESQGGKMIDRAEKTRRVAHGMTG